MNLICNNCGGAYIYNLKNLEYNNPFMWCCIFADDMLTLISEYDNINFNNFDLIRLSKETANANNWTDYKERIFGICIDNKLSVYFTHYLFGEYEKPKVIEPNVFYFRNYEYVYNKFIKRTEKFIKNKEDPIFLIITYKRHGWTDEKIKNLINMKLKYKVICITDKNIHSENDNLKIIKINDLNEKYKFPADAIYTNIKTIFSELE